MYLSMATRFSVLAVNSWHRWARRPSEATLRWAIKWQVDTYVAHVSSLASKNAIVASYVSSQFTLLSLLAWKGI